MVFPVSDEKFVPLTEDVLKQPKEFVKSWGEFNVSEGDTIIRSAQIQDTSVILYSVPENTTLYITHIDISGGTSSLTTGNNRSFVGTIESSSIGLQSFVSIITSTTNARGHSANNADYNPPLKIEGGTDIFLIAQGDVRASIYGFEVPKRILR